MMFLPKYGLLVQIYDKYLRTKALSVVYSCISMLGAMSGVYKVPFWNLTGAIVYQDCLRVSFFVFFKHIRKKPERW